MRLKNKNTGEVFELNELCLYDDKGFARRPFLNSLAELCEEWSDYEEEPKGFWIIESDGSIQYITDDMLYTEYVDGNDFMACCKQIGNKFDTEEEAEKAVEKLKALTRLQDKGFKFCGIDGDCIRFSIDISKVNSTKEKEELNKYGELLFGGEK